MRVSVICAVLLALFACAEAAHAKPTTLRARSVSVKEGSTAKVSVKLRKASKKRVVVKWATKNGSAKAGTDYRKRRGKLVFKRGRKGPKRLSVRLLKDTADERRETLRIKLSGSKRVVKSALVKVTIIDTNAPATITAPVQAPAIVAAPAAPAPAGPAAPVVPPPAGPPPASGGNPTPADPPKRTITVSRSGDDHGTVSSSPAGIDCGSDCTGQYGPGQAVTLSATPAPGYRFASWSGACSGTAPACRLSASGDESATATFAALPVEVCNGVDDTGDGETDEGVCIVTVDAQALGTGTGEIRSSEPGIDCPDTSCSARFPSGVTLTAAPTHGSEFVGWQGTCAGTSTSTCVLEPGDHSVTARFATPETCNDFDDNGDGRVDESRCLVRVSLAGTGSGSVTSDPLGINCPGGSCAERFTPAGTSVALTATPNTGSSFSGWSGDCSGTHTTCVLDALEESATATFTAYPAPAAGDIAINEIQKRGVSSSVGPFIELVNRTDHGLDLGGVEIRQSSSLKHTFGPGTYVAPGCAIVREWLSFSSWAAVTLARAGEELDAAVLYGDTGTSSENREWDDGTGEMVPHDRVGGRRSPGTHADGSPFC